MLMLVEKSVFRATTNILRRFSVALESTVAPPHVNSNDDEDDCVDSETEFTHLRRESVKSLRVAILGLPNVGKSTLVNQLIKRPVCAAGDRVHVTRAKANAVYCQDETQLVFVDTPGLVSQHEFKKFKMEDSFRSDPEDAMIKADIIGVVQDASNKYTRGSIHDRILELLEKSKVGTTSILILNKVDLMKRKSDLLGLVRSLSSDKGWPNFSDVFMVSALTTDGVKDLRNYLLDSAKLRDWEYDSNVVTDQAPEIIVERTVRARLMDALPNEVPYRLEVKMELFNVCADGSLHCVANVYCESPRIAHLVLGKGGGRIKLIARQSEEVLSAAFKTSVRLKVAVVTRKK